MQGHGWPAVAQLRWSDGEVRSERSCVRPGLRPLGENGGRFASSAVRVRARGGCSWSKTPYGCISTGCPKRDRPPLAGNSIRSRRGRRSKRARQPGQEACDCGTDRSWPSLLYGSRDHRVACAQVLVNQFTIGPIFLCPSCNHGSGIATRDTVHGAPNCPRISFGFAMRGSIFLNPTIELRSESETRSDR